MADIVVDIDLGSMSRTRAKLKGLEVQIDQAIKEGLTDFAERFKKHLRANMVAYGVPQSVVSTLVAEEIDGGIELIVAGELVDFFEYGTGVMGASSPHPDPFTPWEYDVNGHGESGWWYPTDDTDPNPYKWTDDSGQLRAWTRGKISRPFVYDTFEWGKRNLTRIVRNHVKRIKID